MIVVDDSDIAKSLGNFNKSIFYIELGTQNGNPAYRLYLQTILNRVSAFGNLKKVQLFSRRENYREKRLFISVKMYIK